MDPELVQRFFSRVAKDCWPWMAGRASHGYGVIGYKGKSYSAHRLSWEIHNGPIPDGQFVCHKCDNPWCVNPAHLFLGTQADNLRDMRRKGRARWRQPPGHRGSDVHCAKLDEEKVKEIKIRLRAGESKKALAGQFGVSVGSIWQIVYGRSWKHVEIE